MESPSTRQALERCAESRRLRSTATPAHPWRRRPQDERRLPLSRHRYPGHIGQRPPARDGVDTRRRIPDRTLRRRPMDLPGPPRCGGGECGIPHGSAGIHGPSGTHQGVERRPFGQLWSAGPDLCPTVGATQYRQLRRRPLAGDHLRRVGRCHQLQHPVRIASGQGPLPGLHQPERRFLRPLARRRQDAHNQCLAARSRATRTQIPKAPEEEVAQATAADGCRRADRQRRGFRRFLALCGQLCDNRRPLPQL